MVSLAENLRRKPSSDYEHAADLQEVYIYDVY